MDTYDWVSVCVSVSKRNREFESIVWESDYLVLTSSSSCGRRASSYNFDAHCEGCYKIRESETWDAHTWKPLREREREREYSLFFFFFFFFFFFLFWFWFWFWPVAMAMPLALLLGMEKKAHNEGGRDYSHFFFFFFWFWSWPVAMAMALVQLLAMEKKHVEKKVEREESTEIER